MSTRTRIAVAAVAIATLAVLATKTLLRRQEPVSVEGVVVLASSRVEEQVPIAGAEVTVTGAGGSARGRSDANGFFRLVLPPLIRPGQFAMLRCSRAGYTPLEMAIVAGRELPVARLVPLAPSQSREPAGRRTPVGNVRVRYSISERTLVNVGTGVKMFETPNRGNVPCNGNEPCSPDGQWKAGIGGASLDAGGADNRFRNARVSCIAGPCPFTRIETDRFSAGGPSIGVTVRDWSDTATFVLQAEVVRVESSDVVRYVYPVILGRTLNFTLPSGGQGPSIEAEIAGTPIVFPLGPRLVLSWATCGVRPNGGQSRVYRCELDPAYRFQ